MTDTWSFRGSRFSIVGEIDRGIVNEQIDKLVSHRHDSMGASIEPVLVLGLNGEVVRAI